MGNCEASWTITLENLRNTHIIDDGGTASNNPGTKGGFPRNTWKTAHPSSHPYSADGVPSSTEPARALPHSPRPVASADGRAKASPPAYTVLDIENGGRGGPKSRSLSYSDLLNSPMHTNTAHDSSSGVYRSGTWPVPQQDRLPRTRREKRKMMACCVVLGLLVAGVLAAIICWIVIWTARKSP